MFYMSYNHVLRYIGTLYITSHHLAVKTLTGFSQLQLGCVWAASTLMVPIISHLCISYAMTIDNNNNNNNNKKKKKKKKD